jgi:uncharacterized protein (DUF3084 family)
MTLVHTLTLIASCFLGSLFPASKALAFETPADDWRIELREIDNELKRAEEDKSRYLALARRDEDEGRRLMRNEKQEAKRAFARADNERKAAQMLDERIATLQARRAQLLKEHPEYKGP